MEDEVHISQVAPETVKITWKLSLYKSEFVEVYFARRFESFINALRLYDLSELRQGNNHPSYLHEIPVRKEVTSWKLKGLLPGHQYYVEIGIKLSSDEFFPLIQSAPFQITANGQRKDEDDGVKILPPVQPLTNKAAPSWEKKVCTYTYYTAKGNRG